MIGYAYSSLHWQLTHNTHGIHEDAFTMLQKQYVGAEAIILLIISYKDSINLYTPHFS